MGIPTLIKTLTASGDSSLSFVHGSASVVLDSTYDEYMFVCNNINPGTDSEVFLFNGSIDAGSNYNVTKTTTFFNALHQESDGDSGLSYRTGNDLAQSTDPQYLTSSIGNGSDECAAGILHLFSPASTTYITHFYSRFNTMRPADELWDCFVTGYFNATADIDAVQFTISSGNFDGVIQLYGIS